MKYEPGKWDNATVRYHEDGDIMCVVLTTEKVAARIDDGHTVRHYDKAGRLVGFSVIGFRTEPGAKHPGGDTNRLPSGQA